MSESSPPTSLEQLNVEFCSLAASQSTQRRMYYQIGRFLGFIQHHQIFNLCLLDGDVLSLWKRSLESQTRLVRRQYMQLIRRFLDWCVGRDLMLYNPLEDDLIEAMPKGYPIRECPDKDEVQELWLHGDFGRVLPLRNRAIFSVIYGLGLRKSEVIALDLRDIKGSSLHVRGKRGKERIVPLSAFVEKALQAYLVHERPGLLAFPGMPAVFLSRQRKRISAVGVHYVFSQQLKSTWSPHQFRHAFATHMLQNGCSVRHLQRFLGHERLSTTAIYTHPEMENLAKMLEKCHPRG